MKNLGRTKSIEQKRETYHYFPAITEFIAVKIPKSTAYRPFCGKSSIFIINNEGTFFYAIKCYICHFFFTLHYLFLGVLKT